MATTDFPHRSDPPMPRRYGAVNWVGLWTLYLKEVRRFLKVFTQTVAAPVVTSLLFLAPGLIVMTMAQNAFANTSSSIMISKIQGNIVDVLMPPISPGEFVCAYALGGTTRGVIVGVAAGLGMSVFVEIGVQHWPYVVFHAVAGSMMLSLLGMLGGIWAEKFDHIQAVTNFVITPFAFLSGTFYSISRLPETVQTLAHFNPFFYMIDGFRYGFIGQADAAPILGLFVMLGINAVLWLAAWRLVRTGYNLKA